MIPFYGAKKQCCEKEVWGLSSSPCPCFAEVYANIFHVLASRAVFTAN